MNFGHMIIAVFGGQDLRKTFPEVPTPLQRATRNKLVARGLGLEEVTVLCRYAGCNAVATTIGHNQRIWVRAHTSGKQDWECRQFPFVQ